MTRPAGRGYRVYICFFKFRVRCVAAAEPSVVGADPSVKGGLRRAIVALEVPVMQLVKEITCPRGPGLLDDDPLEAGM